ncbi:MAG: CapA family protein, partial [Candidatus Nomurabacteria bacterium]|nr:CapA family protein [Candidatus Nomurabacteria bacterium]
MKNNFRSLFIVVLAIVAGFGGVFYVIKTDTILVSGMPANTSTSAERIRELITKRDKIFHVYAVGDIMLSRGVEAKVNRAGGDYNLPFRLISDDLNQADLVFANHEGPMSDLGGDQGGKYSFRFDTKFAQMLAGAGVDIVSLANNHMFDWGKDALCDTPAQLKQVDIDSVGAGCDSARANKPSIQTLDDGTRIAFIAYQNLLPNKWASAGDNRPGMSNFDRQEIVKTIQGLQNNDIADLIFVSIHWGAEYKTRSNIDQQNLAHEWIDAGADVVIGHHPHVAQEIERYGNG